ncbi:hypothetical protein [Endozoicomonas montiporae]|uniref:hypothetical protein n=1 Tax=Endozoicomonas montiporae TaxID=1027273 RepID=UPI000B09E714|nr:hypothetical protein [Endozoicomonas montiporae]
MNLTVESGSKVLLKTGHLKPVEEGHIKAELTHFSDRSFTTACQLIGYNICINQ